MSFHDVDDEISDAEVTKAEINHYRALSGMPEIENEDDEEAGEDAREEHEGSHDQDDEPLDAREKLDRLLGIAPKPKAVPKAVAETLSAQEKPTLAANQDVVNEGDEVLLVTEKPRLTDTGLANYVNDELRDRVAYCKEQTLFVLYDENSQRWIKDKRRHALRIAIRRILHGLPQKLTADVKVQDSIYKRIESASVPGTIAKEMEIIVQGRLIQEFDDNIHLFGVENGVIDLATGQFRSGRAEDLITKTAAVKYDPNARCPEFEKFIAEIMLGQQDLIDYLQTMIGYFLLGDNPENLILFLLGRGANGKTVLLNVIESLFGAYANAIPITVMIKTQRETVGDDIMSIVGYRLLTSRELEKDDRMNAAKIKRLVGNDPESARNLYSEHECVRVKGKFVIATNEIPRIEDDSDGFWRRFKVIPFLRVFKEQEQNKRYEDLLLQEKAGILNWALAGYHKYVQQGLVEPNTCRQLKAEIRGEVNPVENFISQYYEPSAAERVGARSLHAHYTEWAEKTPNAPTLSERRLAAELLKLGIARYRPQGTCYGLKLKQEVAEEEVALSA